MMEAVIATAGFVVKLYKIHSDIFTNIILQKLAGGGVYCNWKVRSRNDFLRKGGAGDAVNTKLKTKK